MDRFSNKGYLFLRELDTSKYLSYSMPKVMDWFRKGRGYISFEKRDTSFCYKECIHGFNTTNGYVYYKPFGKKHDYKTGVQITDTLSINDIWIAHVVTCSGCEE